MKKFVMLVVLLLIGFIGTQSAQACSINAAGSCGGSACESGKSCKKTSDFKCECVADKNSQVSSSLENHLTGSESASDEPAEVLLEDPGRPGVKRLLIAANGFGDVKCGSCSTSAGCNAFWIAFGSSASCKATPAGGHVFNHWIVNGNFGGDQENFRFNGKPGSKLVGHFDPLMTETTEADKRLKQIVIPKGSNMAPDILGDMFECNTDIDIKDTETYPDCDSCVAALTKLDLCPDRCPVWRVYESDCSEQSNGTFDCSVTAQCKKEL